MPQFSHPWFLFLALAVPPLVAWWLWQRRRTFRLPAADQLLLLSSARARIARWGSLFLRALSLLLLAVALSGPRWPDLRTRLDTEGIAIMMLVDVSGSMAERDFDWNDKQISRLEAVKRVFRLFVAGGGTAAAAADGADTSAFEGRATDLIGLITFATRPTTACPLTLSHSVLLKMLDKEDPRSIPGESETNISDALALGLHRLQGAKDRRKVLVLLSDGEHNVPQPRSDWTPRQAAQIAASLGVPIYTIDAGGTAAKPEAVEAAGDDRAVSPGANRAEAMHTLSELARMTGGKLFQAHDTASLLEACRAIDRLERTQIHSFQYRRYHEGYPWFALGSFVCLALLLGLEMTFWRRLP